MTLLSLRSGPLALDLAPDAGGSIQRFARQGAAASVPVMRAGEVPEGGRENGRDSSCYPLVPYSNRIANGRLVFAGGSIQLAPNWPGVRHPMHGDGWSSAWTVVARDEQSADLVLDHDGSVGWPFRYRARQSFRLAPDRLSVAISVENLEERAVPAGIGLHPFFPRDAETTLRCRTAAVWLTDEEVLPVGRVPVPPEWDFRAPRPVEGLALDNCFDGWDGLATIAWPSHGIALDLQASEAFAHLVIYVPPSRRYFCVEPVSHANGQVGQALLMPGATLSGEIVFRLSVL